MWLLQLGGKGENLSNCHDGKCHYLLNHDFQQPLVAFNSSFFFERERALMEIEEPGRVESTPHSIAANSEAGDHRNQDISTNRLLPDRGEIEPTFQTCQNPLLLGLRYVISSVTQTDTSWWQTGPIFSKLGNADKGSMDPYHTTVKGYRLPLQQWSSPTQAPVQFALDSVHAEALATKISGLVLQEPGSPSQSPSQKQRRVASNYRFVASESLFKLTPLQDGRAAHGAINPTEGFLNGQDRPKGCVLNSTSSRRVPPSAGLSKWPGKAPAVSNSPIRALHCSLYLHEIHKTNDQIFETDGSTHCRILGRHVTVSPVRIPVAPGSSNHKVAPCGPGVHNKPPQVCAHAEYTARVSGFPDQYTDNDHSFTACQDFRFAEGSIRIVETQSSSNQVFRTAHRETCDNQTSSLYNSITSPSTAESEGSHHSCSSGADSLFTGGLQGLEMVNFTTPGALLFTTAEIGGIHSDSIRSIYSGLGSSLSGSEN